MADKTAADEATEEGPEDLRTPVVSTATEMALYYVAVKHPQAFAEAEREARTFCVAMLANDSVALRRARAIVALGATR